MFFSNLIGGKTQQWRWTTVMLDIIRIIFANNHSFSQWESLEKNANILCACEGHCQWPILLQSWAVFFILPYLLSQPCFSALRLKTAMDVLHHIERTDLHSGVLATFQWRRLAKRSPVCYSKLILLFRSHVQYVLKTARHLYKTLRHWKCMQRLTVWMTGVALLTMSKLWGCLMSGSPDLTVKRGFVSYVHCCEFVEVGF